MRKLAAVVVLSAALAGCGTTGFLNRDRPDEFQVSRQAPLVIPPDFALTPPNPGAPRPQDSDASQQALDALFGGPAPRSQSETSLLERAGRDRAEIGARSNVGDNVTRIVDKGRTTSVILATTEGDSSVATAQVPQ